MDDNEIINLWRRNDKKLEDTLLLNRQNLADITKIKVQSLLWSVKPIKIFAVLVGLLWVGLADILIINLWHFASPFFLISASIQVLLTKLAVGIYLYQLILLEQASSNEPVLAAQEKIARLQSSTLWVARFLFLQLPLWTTFYWNKTMITNGNIWLIILQVVVTFSFTFVAVWLFRNIKYEHRHKKWFAVIFNGKEWNSLMKSMELLSQLNDYKTEK